MVPKKFLALSKRDRMGFNHLDLVELGPGNANQIVDNLYDHFPDDIQVAFDQQVEGAMHRSRQAVLDGRQNIIRQAIANGREGSLERRPRHEFDVVSEKRDRGLLAESSTL